VNLPLLKITFPELEHFSEEERRAIVRSCLEADVMKSLGKQAMFCMRVCWGVLAACAIGSIVLVQSVVDVRVGACVIGGILLFSLLALPLCLYLFYSRGRRLLRELVQEKLESKK
jgi:hypothetical protein